MKGRLYEAKVILVVEGIDEYAAEQAAHDYIRGMKEDERVTTAFLDGTEEVDREEYADWLPESQ